MARKKQNLKPDTVLKNYWSGKEEFADLFNAVLFQGRQVIDPDELEDMDTEESTVLENKEYAESIISSRDIIKVRKKSTAHGVEMVLLGLESQESVHYAMPMRVMGLDYSAYKKQYDNIAKMRVKEKGLTEAEYLSRMRKEDKLSPVISVVVYWGEKEWDGAKNLHGMLDISEEMLPFVNDYKMLLVEARENRLNLHNMNNVDLFNLLEILQDRSCTLNETKKKAIDYAKEHKVEKSVIMAVAGVTDHTIDYDALEKKGELDMYTVVKEIREEGRAEEIIDFGYECGISEEDILQRLQKRLNISLQKAQEYLQAYGKQMV